VHTWILWHHLPRDPPGQPPDSGLVLSGVLSQPPLPLTTPEYGRMPGP